MILASGWSRAEPGRFLIQQYLRAFATFPEPLLLLAVTEKAAERDWRVVDRPPSRMIDNRLV
jgi:hypothetical protein